MRQPDPQTTTKDPIRITAVASAGDIFMPTPQAMETLKDVRKLYNNFWIKPEGDKMFWLGWLDGDCIRLKWHRNKFRLTHFDDCPAIGIEDPSHA